MNCLSVIKKKMKKAVVPASVALLASASVASAAIDFTAVTADITTAIGDYLAGGAILLAAFAGIWGMKKVMGLFANS